MGEQDLRNKPSIVDERSRAFRMVLSPLREKSQGHIVTPEDAYKFFFDEYLKEHLSFTDKGMPVVTKQCQMKALERLMDRVKSETLTEMANKYLERQEEANSRGCGG